jgi:hypothetical protein
VTTLVTAKNAASILTAADAVVRKKKMMNRLTLKWGTIKAWSLETNEAKAALKKWADGGVSFSAAMQNNTPEQKQAILNLIELMDEIWLDWEHKKVSREEAKQYVRNYANSSE